MRPNSDQIKFREKAGGIETCFAWIGVIQALYTNVTQPKFPVDFFLCPLRSLG